MLVLVVGRQPSNERENIYCGCEVLWRVCLCVCVSVCLSARISPKPRARSLPFSVHVAYGRGSVLLRRRCDTSVGFMNDIMFVFYNGPYSGMNNFATKDRFRLNLLIYRTEFNFLLLKRIILTISKLLTNWGKR